MGTVAAAVPLVVWSCAGAAAAEPEHPRHLGAGWYALAAGGQLADAWSTRRALDRGGREVAHPWVGPEHPAAFWTYKAAIGLGVTGLGSWVDYQGQRRHSRALRFIGRGLPIFTGGIGLAAAIHNERAMVRGTKH